MQVLRSAPSADFIRDNVSLIQDYWRKLENDELIVSLGLALTRVPDAVNGALLVRLRAALNRASWLLCLYELAVGEEISSDILVGAIMAFNSPSPVERTICNWVLRNRGDSNEVDELASEVLTLTSPTEQLMAISFLTNSHFSDDSNALGFFREMQTRNFSAEARLLATSLIENVVGEGMPGAVKSLWAHEIDGAVRKALQGIEERLRTSINREKERAAWQVNSRIQIQSNLRTESKARK